MRWVWEDWDMQATQDQSFKTVEFPIEAGRLVVRGIRKGLRELAWRHGVNVSIDQEPGWLTVWLLVKVSGGSDAVRLFLADVTSWIKRVDDV